MRFKKHAVEQDSSVRYGLRIGDVGVEFTTKEERSNALLVFTRGSDVEIKPIGVKYQIGHGKFSVYERDLSITTTICAICSGEFDILDCGKRLYPIKYSWNSEYSDTEGYICDACYTRKISEFSAFQGGGQNNKLSNVNE